MDYQSLDEIKLSLSRNQITNMFSPIYDVILKVSGHLDEAENFESTFSPFILTRYLSMNNKLLHIAEILNCYQDKLSKKDFYKFAYSIVPKSSRCFWKYIKKTTKKKKEDIEDNEKTHISNLLF